MSKTVSSYAEVATMHGVYYTCETKYGRLSMFFWLLVVIALVALGIFLTVKVSSVEILPMLPQNAKALFIPPQQTYSNWQNNKIVTTVKTTGLPVRYVPFPAITICGLGSVEKVMADMLWGQAVDFVQQKKGVDVSETAIDLPWDQALESNGIDPSDFIAAEYPSMEEDPTELFSILVSRNPRSILLSEYAFQSACTNETRAEAEALEAQVQADPAQFCPTGTVFDERLPYCYSVIRIQSIVYFPSNKKIYWNSRALANSTTCCGTTRWTPATRTTNPSSSTGCTRRPSSFS